MTTVTEILRLAYQVMEYPWALLLVIPALIILLWTLHHRFVEIVDEPEIVKRKRRVRRLMHFTRFLLVMLLCIAIASPYVQEEKMIEGDPFIQLLVDNSTSMGLFEDVSSQLADALEKKTNTEVKVIGTSTVSNIGDSVLNNLEPHTSTILLSDGNVNAGASLGDVALFASKLNATVNAIKITPKRNDAGVVIYGPAKTLEHAETNFVVFINRVGNIKSVNLKVTLDGEVIYDKPTSEPAVEFTRKLTKGTHKVKAEISSQDHFAENNAYYKTIKVVPQPKLLLYSQKSTPLETLLKQLYVVDTVSSISSSIEDYYTVIVNDIPAEDADRASGILNDFVADGNGMVVFGGENSYDLGNYDSSVFESMLPVMVGTPEKKEGDVLLAIVIDISGSQGAAFGKFTSTADFSKSATVDIIRNLKPDTRVAIIAFNDQAYLLSEPSPVFSKQNVENLIARLRWGGGTNVAAGVLKAASVLNAYSGSKNIILLSDGKTQAKASAIEAAQFTANSGIKIYTVGVGPTTDEEFMMDVAEITNGIYFRATDESKLKVLFGPIDEQQTETGKMELVIINENHFITSGFEPDKAVIYGYNQVSPKGAGRLLATTSTGEPLLTVWRLGLGRVAAYSTDDGGKWAGSLLGERNSKLISRTMNWAIGDPERKSQSFIDAKDTTLNEPAELTIRSKKVPEAEGVVFYKIDEETYSASIIPKQTGFQEAAGAVFAVNYATEYLDLGLSKELNNIVSSTGGRMFSVEDTASMVTQARTRARRVVNDRTYYRWPFVILAAALFILEIFIRRIMRTD